MKFILASDSFKESMTAQEACAAMEKGIRRMMPEAICIAVPLADGGEGTLRTLIDLLGGNIYQHKVKDPMGIETIGEYGIIDGDIGMVELASASGLHLVPVEKRNPMIATTYGTGQLIKAVLGHGIKKLIIGLGGSATNDGGAGIAQALGVRLLDRDGNEIGAGGGELGNIVSIDTSALVELKNIEIEVACDVNNPLTGKNGASHIYGPQKGATEEMVRVLDRNLEQYANKIKECLHIDVKEIEGAGAAGGTGAGLMAFLKARKISGIDMVIKYSRLEEKIRDADYIFTGEGSIDRQVAFGKTISGVISLAKKYKKPVVAFAGKIADVQHLYQMGITAVFGIVPYATTLTDALQQGKENLENSVYSVTRLIGYTNTVK